MRNAMQQLSFLICAAALSLQAWSQVKVTEAWVRGTVPAQKSTGAFMTLNAERDVTLVEVRSEAAGRVEVHEMAMANNVMTMSAVPKLPLPAGKSVELKPGGYHLMMLELKQPLKAGDSVAITLVVEGRDGKRQDIQAVATVRPLGQ
ncbi:hypothetical protein BWI17_10355 [Betaproteobacteria bacterium GR16-43]|nr:hypothetical protein BWI17_10355 [Betaproteobacteria bacterium GR16-43]